MSADPTTVIREHARFIWRTLRHLGVPAALLEDACQDVFVVIFRRLADFEGRSSLATWIYGICRNVAMTARRSESRRREVLNDTVSDAAISAGQVDTLARRQARDQLTAVLSTLPEAKRMVFVLHEIECLPISEVAQAVGCNERTAYSRLYAARKQVRGVLVRSGVLEPEQPIGEVV